MLYDPYVNTFYNLEYLFPLTECLNLKTRSLVHRFFIDSDTTLVVASISNLDVF